MIVDILGTEYTVTRNTSAIEGMGWISEPESY